MGFDKPGVCLGARLTLCGTGRNATICRLRQEYDLERNIFPREGQAERIRTRGENALTWGSGFDVIRRVIICDY